LKAPGTKRVQLKYDHLLSRLDFSFNLRRYTKAIGHPLAKYASLVMAGATLEDIGFTQAGFRFLGF